MDFFSTSSPENLSLTPAQVNQNSTSVTYCPPRKDAEWVFTVLPVYILLVAVFGILFNLLVLMVFCCHKKVCTVPEVYLGNLAAADLVLVSSLPFWASNVSDRYNWSFGSALCKLVNVSISVNTYCSIYFLVLISIDRFVALVHPLSQTRMRRPKCAKLCCLLVWTLGLLLNLPELLYRKVAHIPSLNTTFCYLDFPSPLVYLLHRGVKLMFSFIIPVSIISLCSSRIIRALRKREEAQKKEMKATTLVLAVLLAFLVCWVPFHLTGMVQLLSKAAGIKQCSFVILTELSLQVFTYFAFFNSVINPVLYVLVGKSFQRKVQELIGQLSCRDRTSTGSTSYF